ncbi:hypothetical protein KFU94_46075 [Chloroflexi bacterium TSY]|nr:hypothetical protein [Chloroflexi bacterium TSY]
MADFSVLSGQIADAVAQSNEPAAAQSSSQSLAVVQQAMARKFRYPCKMQWRLSNR